MPLGRSSAPTTFLYRAFLFWFWFWFGLCHMGISISFMICPSLGMRM
jgi:hypothetical protein